MALSDNLLMIERVQEVKIEFAVAEAAAAAVEEIALSFHP